MPSHLWRTADFVFAAVLVTRAGAACSRIEPVPAPELLVRRAEVIVLVTAEDVWRWPDSGTGLSGVVEFRVEASLKGSLPGNLLRIEGTLTANDDFNDSPFPYTFVRPEGRRGNCKATTYKKDGMFLLMLKATPDPPKWFEPFKPAWTPYWEALAPTNEQLHGPDDPWVGWVRQHVLTR